MDKEQNTLQDMQQTDTSPSPAPPAPEKEPSSTPTGKRVLAFIGVVFMVLLVLAYTYSLATGGIFAW